MALAVKNPPANAAGLRDVDSTPGAGRPPGGGHDNPLQYSCLENPMNRGTWRATVYDVAKTKHIILSTTHIKLWYNIFKYSYMHYKNIVYQ